MTINLWIRLLARHLNEAAEALQRSGAATGNIVNKKRATLDLDQVRSLVMLILQLLFYD